MKQFILVAFLGLSGLIDHVNASAYEDPLSPMRSQIVEKSTVKEEVFDPLKTPITEPELNQNHNQTSTKYKVAGGIVGFLGGGVVSGISIAGFHYYYNSWDTLQLVIADLMQLGFWSLIGTTLGCAAGSDIATDIEEKRLPWNCFIIQLRRMKGCLT